MPEQKEYYIAIGFNNGSTRKVPVLGQSIKIYGLDLFLHKYEGVWRISEPRSGRYLAESTSKKKLIQETKRFLTIRLLFALDEIESKYPSVSKLPSMSESKEA